MHQIQVQQINNLQLEKLKSNTEQIQNLQNQLKQKDSMIQQVNSLSSNYQKQLNEANSRSGTNIVAIVIAIIIGVVIGIAISNK